jgi:hypothetical protein
MKPNPGFRHWFHYLLSDQAICLYFIKKPAGDRHFSALSCTFRGQKHGRKDFRIL